MRRAPLAFLLTIALVGAAPGQARSSHERAREAEPEMTWLDQSTPTSWTTPGLSIPAAPPVQGEIDPRCRERARPPELEEDRRVQDQGWHLDGAFQGGWHVLVIRGTASYDGMCRPRQYQAFVFVRGVFAGTLSPDTMDSRTDGALTELFLQSDIRLTAEYVRYTARDPACCPSSATRVLFEIVGQGPVLRPLASSTTSR